MLIITDTAAKTVRMCSGAQVQQEVSAKENMMTEKPTVNVRFDVDDEVEVLLTEAKLFAQNHRDALVVIESWLDGKNGKKGPILSCAQVKPHRDELCLFRMKVEVSPYFKACLAGLRVTYGEYAQKWPAWIVTVAAKLAEFVEYPENWDSYGGHPPSRALADKVLTCIEDAAKLLAPEHADMPSPSVVPSDGAVQLEWRLEEKELELEFSEGGLEWLHAIRGGKGSQSQSPVNLSGPEASNHVSVLLSWLTTKAPGEPGATDV